MVKQIAEQCDIPAHFLAKILQQMARKGFLRSSKGPTGGFCLRMPAAEISMLQLVDTIDGLTDYERCPGGMTECNDSAPCVCTIPGRPPLPYHGVSGAHLDRGPRQGARAEEEEPRKGSQDQALHG